MCAASACGDTGADLSVAPFSFSDTGDLHSGEFTSQICTASNADLSGAADEHRDHMTWPAIASASEKTSWCDVRQPILAVGKLLKAGWSISTYEGIPYLVSADGFSEIPLEFHKHSLEMKAEIRMPVHVSDELKQDEFLELGSAFTEQLLDNGMVMDYQDKTDRLTDPRRTWSARFLTGLL